jgi:hypothetical protein
MIAQNLLSYRIFSEKELSKIIALLSPPIAGAGTKTDGLKRP